MSRTKAREVAMKIAFAITMGGDASFVEVLEQSGISEAEMQDRDMVFANGLVEGVKAHETEIDSEINTYAVNWTADRIPKVELAILRIAIYELMYSSTESTATIINAAVELAKRFCDEKSPSYINGLLGSFSRKEKTDEPD